MSLKLTQQQFDAHQKWKRNRTADVVVELVACPKPAKYRNQKVDGFDSKREAAHAQLLDALGSATERSVRVVHVMRQVRFELVPKQQGERAMAYIADFLVLFADGHYEVQDAKGMRTQTYIAKRKLMLERYEIRVKEV